MRLTLATDLVTASASSRTIAGRVVTFGEAGRTSAGPAMFLPGSITIPGDVTLMNEHDTTAPLGKSIEMAETAIGIDAVFRVIRTSRGDDALVEASEGVRAGFSVGVDVLDHEYRDGVLTVLASTLDHVGLVTRPAIASALVDSVAAAFTPQAPDPAPAEPDAPAAEEIPVTEVTDTTVAEVTAAVPHVPTVTVQDAFPYRPGVNASFFRDMYNARHDDQAAARVHAAQAMLTAAGQVTSDVSTMIPPGYRPDLYVDEVVRPTPVVGAFANYAIADATPFKVPTFSASSGLSSDHVEGTNPTDGDITFSEITVSPKAVSGSYLASREMLDAANPNLDAIILSAMREEYSRELETYVAGVIVGGATAGAGLDEATVTEDLGGVIAAFASTRFASPDRILVSSAVFQALAADTASDGRPMNPYIGPSNANGVITAGAASILVVGLEAQNAWGLTTTGSLVAKATDAAVFLSGLNTWRWEEVAGPASIKFASFGYVGAAVLRASGVVKSAYTPTAP